MAFVEGGGDRYGLANLDRVVCPDCGKGYLQRVQAEPDKLVCGICQLLIPEAQLRQELTLVPQTGMGVDVTNKPYFQQTMANSNYVERDRRPPLFSLDDMTNKERLDQFSLKSMALKKKGGIEIRQSTRAKQQGKQDDTIAAVRKLVKNLGTDIKVQLD